MSEKIHRNEKLIQIGKLLESKRLELGAPYKSREAFIEKRSDELFGSEEWISSRHLYNVEHGYNWISIEKFLILSRALEEDPVELFREIASIWLSSDKNE